MDRIEVSMNEKTLTLTLNGQLTDASVRGLIKELDYGFDYYQFPQITVCLDSPGGEYLAMHRLLNAFKARRLSNRAVHVHAAHMCASAAALVLAYGTWGKRTVEPDTHLLFHWTRATFEAGQVLTSDSAAILARGLSTVDQKTLAQLVTAMSEGAGGVNALLDTMMSRLQEVLDHWVPIAATLHSEMDRRSVKQFAWVKEMQRNIKRWSAECDATKQTKGIVTFLKSHFERDQMMDLRQAYAMCLIDRVQGVLPIPTMLPIPSKNAAKPKAAPIAKNALQSQTPPSEAAPDRSRQVSEHDRA